MEQGNPEPSSPGSQSSARLIPGHWTSSIVCVGKSGTVPLKALNSEALHFLTVSSSAHTHAASVHVQNISSKIK
jgi:hypothetical protein